MKSLDTEQLKNLKQGGEKATLVNTLDPDGFGQTHIPDSINVPLSSKDFAQRVEQAAGGKDQPVVVYCASKDCNSSTKAGKQLEQAGFNKVYDYEGGAKAWQEAGEALATGA